MEKLNFQDTDEFTNEYPSKTHHQDFDANLRLEFLKKITHQLESLENIEFHHLEEIKTHLALSGRQICLLLKMDPSAWSRWAKSKTIPRHVYQSLVWYVQLIFKTPKIHEPFILEKKIQAQARESDMKFSTLKKQIETLIAQRVDVKTDVVGELGEKVQESFENILLKFRDQMMPQKAFEIESLKYENKKLHDKIFDLQKQLIEWIDRTKKDQKESAKEAKNQTNVVVNRRKQNKRKKISKKKPRASRSVLKVMKTLKKKRKLNVGSSKKLRRSKKRRR